MNGKYHQTYLYSSVVFFQVKLHCLRTEELEVKGEDSCDKTGQSSADVTVSEKNPPQPLSYDMFVKEISKEKFICKVCKKVWPSKEKTLAHVPSHSEENLRRNRNVRLTVNCVTCGKWFATKSHLRAHIKDVHLNPCKRKVFNNMFAHLSPFQCPVCDKKFKWASDLKQHVLHHGERQLSRVPGLELKYACDVCRLAFITKVSCKSHKDMYHVEESRYDADKDLRGKNVYDILYQCDKCRVECERLEQIEEHVKECDLQTSGSGSTHDKSIIEDGDNDQPSDINGVGKSVGALSHKPFHGGSLSEMQKVIKILKHSDTSDSDWSSMYSILVSCLVCHAKFTSVSEVRDHKKKHHPSEKPVKKKPPKQAIHMCDLCGVIYKNNASLLIHMHVVHNIQFQMKRKKQECKKPDAESLKWNCLYCSQRFRQRCGLRVHVVTHHTIEQLKQDYRFAERDKANYEYQCHLCKNKMKLYKSLQTHLRRFHGVRISRDSGSEYYDFDLAQKKTPSKETKQDSVPVQENVIFNQEQIHFEASAGPKGDLDMADISINSATTYQQPIPNMQDVGSNLVQPYQTQDYVLLNTGLQLTFSGYPPVQ